MGPRNDVATSIAPSPEDDSGGGIRTASNSQNGSQCSPSATPKNLAGYFPWRLRWRTIPAPEFHCIMVTLSP
jgi:hypothetical protein